MFDRVAHPARGRAGGGNGAEGRVYVKDGPQLNGKGRDVVPAGSTLVMETPGGGGIGEVQRRSSALVRADVDAGLVSPAAALRDYEVD